MHDNTTTNEFYKKNRNPYIYRGILQVAVLSVSLASDTVKSADFIATTGLSHLLGSSTTPFRLHALSIKVRRGIRGNTS